MNLLNFLKKLFKALDSDTSRRNKLWKYYRKFSGKKNTFFTIHRITEC